MKNTRAIVVSDSHLGMAPPESEALLHRFLKRVPEVASHLIINGDLFEFWFEYRKVIPRDAFRTLALLRQIRDADVRLTVLGGNHDRWGSDFWTREMDAEFHRGTAELTIAGWRAFVAHGDGLLEQETGGKWIHRITRWPITEGTFRAIHPDLGFRIVNRLSKLLADTKRRTEEELRALGAIQTAWARALMERRDEIELVILGHTHYPVNEEFGPRNRFLNPGAWCPDGCYAVIDANGCKLMQYNELEDIT